MLPIQKNNDFLLTSGERSLIKPPQKEYDADKKPCFGYFGVLNQYNLLDKTTMAFPLYKKHTSKIFMNSPKFGLVEYVNFDFEFNNTGYNYYKSFRFISSGRS